MASKSTEELQREREEAQKQLEQLLDSSRPKGLKEGLTSGTSNIVQGAVGAAGVAVIAPTMGLAVGLQRGGLVGGALGVAGGAVVGAVGAAALAVGGAISGIMQIGRGIVATPESLVAPRQGKWWNEYEGKWVKTKLPEEAKTTLEGVPDDDSDILGGVAEEIEASIRDSTSGGGEVKDMAYYDALEVPATAEPSAIKRKYYLLARKYHPDKVGADDKEAAEKFKEIAEAYQVLSDPELRAKYDKEGKDGLSADKTDVVGAMNPNIDPALLYAFLFGSDKFKDYIGRLSTATSAVVGDSQKVSIADARKLQKRRVTRLALKLVEKVSPWVEQSIAMGEAKLTPAIEEEWKKEAVELSQTSYGYPLVTTIGKIYDMLAVMFEGSIDSGIGLPSLSKWAARQQATLEKKKDVQEAKMNQLKAGLEMMKSKVEFEQKLAEAKTEEEKQAIVMEMQESVTAILLRVMWTTTVVDLTSALHETTKMVFFDQSVDKETQKLRAKAVKALGQIWMDCPAPTDDGKAPAQLYEEAAFAAMVETMNRKDEAAYK